MDNGGITDDEKKALSELFDLTTLALNKGVHNILGRNSDIAMVLHLAHEEDEPCNGAIVLSSSEDLGVTFKVMSHGMITIGTALEAMMSEGPDGSDTKH